MSMKECVLCGATEEELKEKYSRGWSGHRRKNRVNIGYHHVRPHKKKVGHTIEDHHISYFPEDEVPLCSTCHMENVHGSNELPEYKPPEGHGTIFYKYFIPLFEEIGDLKEEVDVCSRHRNSLIGQLHDAERKLSVINCKKHLAQDDDLDERTRRSYEMYIVAYGEEDE